MVYQDPTDSEVTMVRQDQTEEMVLMGSQVNREETESQDEMVLLD